jgi:hypothetical protein
MFGITIRLGASKDQIVNTMTGEVMFDRYKTRNSVQRVQIKSDKPSVGKGPINLGMHYVAMQGFDTAFVRMAERTVVDSYRRIKA